MPTKTKKKLTKEEQIAELQQEIEQEHLAKEKAKFKEIKCQECGTVLPVDLDFFMQMGAHAREIICPKDEMVNKVTVVYDSPPEVGEAKITVAKLDFVWLAYSVDTLNAEQKEKLVLQYAKDVDAGESRLAPNDQLFASVLGKILRGK